jgi:hypothetical protein
MDYGIMGINYNGSECWFCAGLVLVLVRCWRVWCGWVCGYGNGNGSKAPGMGMGAVAQVGKG